MDELNEAATLSPCQTCGACCATSADWPRFSLESEDEIERIPLAYIAEDQSGMRCNADRCAALSGDIGQFTACVVYQVRPYVCRDCQPGDDACTIARKKHGLAPLVAQF